MYFYTKTRRDSKRGALSGKKKTKKEEEENSGLFYKHQARVVLLFHYHEMQLENMIATCNST